MPVRKKSGNLFNDPRINSKNVKRKYKLSKRKFKTVNEVSDQGIGFDDTLKAGNSILSIVLRTNRMIGWIV